MFDIRQYDIFKRTTRADILTDLLHDVDPGKMYKAEQEMYRHQEVPNYNYNQGLH